MGFGVGCSCYCGKTVAMLSPDGDVLWKRSRPRIVEQPYEMSLLYDEANDYLYTLGSPSVGSVAEGDDDGYVMCWENASVRPELRWRSRARPHIASPTFASFSASRHRLIFDSEGFIWAIGNSSLGRFDPADGVQVSQYTFPAAGIVSRIFAGTDGSCVYKSTQLHRVDRDGNLVNTDSSGLFVQDAVQVSDGFVAGYQTFSGKRYIKFDDTLNEVASYNSLVEPLDTRILAPPVMHAVGDIVYALEGNLPAGSQNRIAKYDSSGMTQVAITSAWSNVSFIPLAESQFCDNGTSIVQSNTLRHVLLDSDMVQQWTVGMFIPQSAQNAHSSAVDLVHLVLVGSQSRTAQVRSYSVRDGSERWRAIWNEDDGGQRTCRSVLLHPGGSVFCGGALSGTGF